MQTLATLWRSARWLAAIAASLLLIACSGGGGGGGGGGGNSGDGFTLSTTSLSFSAEQNGALPPSQNIQANVTNPEAYYVGAAYQSGVTPASWLNVDVAGSGSSWTFQFSVNTTGLSPGTYTTTIGLGIARADGSIITYKNIGVSYTIEGPAITTSLSQLTISLVHGGATPPASNINVSSGSGNAISYVPSINYMDSVTGWLYTTGNYTAPGSLGVGVNTTLLPPGTYTANVILTPSNGKPPSTIQVNYTVTASSLALNSTSVTFSIDANSTSADADIKRTIIVSNTGSSLSWSASSSAPWLSVSPASGINYGTVSLTLVPSQLDTLDNGQHTATVTFTYSGSYVLNQTVSLPVTLNLNLPKVDYVAPYVASSNTSKQVIVRGSGFGSITSQKLLFGTTAASSFSVLSDTEIHVNHPALAPGNYKVHMENNLGTDRSQAILAVVDAPAYLAATIPYGITPRRVIFDAERQALLVANNSGYIYRFAFSNSSWQTTPTTTYIATLRDLDISPDGQQLIALSDNAILELDPITLATVKTTSAPFSSFYYFYHLAMANDGYAIVTTGLNGSGDTQAYRYSARKAALTSVASYPTNYFYFGTPGASTDGSRVVIIEGGGVSPAPYVSQYDASTGALANIYSVSLNQNYLTRPVLNRTASRIILNDFIVYNGNYVQQGLLPTVPFGSSAAIALSPDGAKAYSYTGGTVLHTYDLNNLPVAGIFPEIGSGTTLPVNLGSTAKMAISPDGGTLFIVGSQIVILPAP